MVKLAVAIALVASSLVIGRPDEAAPTTADLQAAVERTLATSFNFEELEVRPAYRGWRRVGSYSPQFMYYRFTRPDGYWADHIEVGENRYVSSSEAPDRWTWTVSDPERGFPYGYAITYALRNLSYIAESAVWTGNEFRTTPLGGDGFDVRIRDGYVTDIFDRGIARFRLSNFGVIFDVYLPRAEETEGPTLTGDGESAG